MKIEVRNSVQHYGSSVQSVGDKDKICHGLRFWLKQSSKRGRNMRKLALVACAVLFAVANAHAGLIGYWNFNGNAADSSVNGNNGSVAQYGGATFAYDPGKFGTAASFYNPVGNIQYGGSYVNVPNSASLSGAWTAFTVSTWVKTLGMGPAMSKLLFEQDPPSYAAYGFQSGGSWYTTVATPSAGAWNDSQWNNIVLRWDGATMTTYLNGVQQDSKATTGFVNGNSVLRFGYDSRSRDGVYVGSSYNGYVDDAAIFDNAFTVAETISIYNVGSSELGYSMADMIKLFDLHTAAGNGITTTSDGKQWQYTATGATGAAGVLAGSKGSYSVRFSDSASAGVMEYTDHGTVLLLR